MLGMRHSDLGADSVTRAIGGRVRRGRGSRGWTLDQLAERSGVSRRMLVSIEQGSANPSIATLLLVSDALGIGLPALVDMDRSPGLRVTRAGSAAVLWRGKLGGQAVLVAGTEPPDVTELWDWTLGPGESHSSEAHAAGSGPGDHRADRGRGEPARTRVPDGRHRGSRGVRAAPGLPRAGAGGRGP